MPPESWNERGCGWSDVVSLTDGSRFTVYVAIRIEDQEQKEHGFYKAFWSATTKGRQVSGLLISPI
jgi:hypothetical protein